MSPSCIFISYFVRFSLDYFTMLSNLEYCDNTGSDSRLSRCGCVMTTISRLGFTTPGRSQHPFTHASIIE